jgi:hypothetical protein
MVKEGNTNQIVVGRPKGDILVRIYIVRDGRIVL